MMRQTNLTPMEKRRCIEFVENLVKNANGSKVMELPYKDYNNLIKELLGGDGDDQGQVSPFGAGPHHYVESHGDRVIKPSASNASSNPAIGGVTAETPEVKPHPKGQGGGHEKSQAIRNCLITSLSAYGFKMAWAKSGVVLIKTNNERPSYVKFIPALRRYLADEVIRNYERYIIRRDENGIVVRVTRRDTERLKRELGIASTQLLVYALTTTAELMGLKVISVWRGKVKIFIPFELLNEVPITKRF